MTATHKPPVTSEQVADFLGFAFRNVDLPPLSNRDVDDIARGLADFAGRLVVATPAATWREADEPDPHGSRYDCERAQLIGGHLTDDQVANLVFLEPTIANLTVAKDRIRWLSRALVAATSGER